jgi:hypothetical protein
MSVNVWLTWTLTPRAPPWQAAALSPVRMVMTAPSAAALVSSGSPAGRQVVKSMWNSMTRAFMVRPR